MAMGCGEMVDEGDLQTEKRWRWHWHWDSEAVSLAATTGPLDSRA